MLKYFLFIGLFPCGIIGQTLVANVPVQDVSQSYQPMIIPGQFPQQYPYQQIQYQPQLSNPYLNNGMQYPYPYPLPFPYPYQPNNPYGINYPPGYPIPQVPLTPNVRVPVIQQIPVPEVEGGVEILEPGMSGLIPLSPMDAAILDLKNKDYGHAEEYYYGREDLPLFEPYIRVRGGPVAPIVSVVPDNKNNPVKNMQPRSGIPFQTFIPRSQIRNKSPPFTVKKPEHYEIYKYH